MTPILSSGVKENTADAGPGRVEVVFLAAYGICLDFLNNLTQIIESPTTTIARMSICVKGIDSGDDFACASQNLPMDSFLRGFPLKELCNDWLGVNNTVVGVVVREVTYIRFVQYVVSEIA